MITKTYLDGKLNQLEENLKRRIEMKDSFQTEEINKKISDLRDSVNLINEKVIENKDILDNYLVEHNGMKERLEKLEGILVKSSEDKNERSDDKDNDSNDQITNDF